MQQGSEETPASAGGTAPGIVVGGKFTLLRLIAEGGVGSVYEAEDALIGRRVALKLLHPHFARHPDTTRRFLREAQATASIDHPHVVTILEMGIQPDGTLFIVQELLRGANLRRRLAERGRIEADEALQIALPIADALAAAHRRGIVHRDVKPDNIVLARNSSSELVPKLIDFGVAKVRAAESKGFATLTGTLLGTTAYMSPEQARGDATIDGRADVWGLATVLFEALSGKCPYDGPTEHAILVQILTATGPPRWPESTPRIPPDLLELVRAGLERDAERRPAMHLFRERLLACFQGLGRVLGALPAQPMDLASEAAPPTDTASLTDVFELAQGNAVADGEERPARSAPTRIWTPAAHPGIEWRPAGDDTPPPVEQLAVMAEEALRINALEDAILHAEEAIEQAGADEALAGRMRLTQAIASYWLGRYVDAETEATAAMTKLEPATTGWYAALGHVAMAGGHRGQGERLAALALDLGRAGAADHPARIVAACRLIVQLVRTGAPDRAGEMLAGLDAGGAARAAGEIFVRAWLAAARAEVAVHDGDPMRYMELVKESVDDFVAAGDIRNASLQRSNIGNAYLQLGGYRAAVRVLTEAVATAEPMKLSFAAGARANLGFALARTGQLDEALTVESEALGRFLAHGNRRFEAVAQLYLALILTSAGRGPEAEASARAAVLAAEGTPGIRAHALAVLANLALDGGRTAEGVDLAGQAAALLEAQAGVEEGEAWIRVVHASAMAQSGDAGAAARLILHAKSRLLERANRISDARWRERFLRNIPENAQTLAFAKLWGEPRR